MCAYSLICIVLLLVIFMLFKCLTHWGRVTHICVSKLNIIGSDNGLSPGRRQAIIRTNAGILLIRPLGTNFSEFLVEILIFSFKKMRLKVSSAKRRPFCLGLNELMCQEVLVQWQCVGTLITTLCNRSLIDSILIQSPGVVSCRWDMGGSMGWGLGVRGWDGCQGGGREEGVWYLNIS